MKSKFFVSWLLVLSLFALPVAPAFAQLGDVTPPTPPPTEPTPPPVETPSTPPPTNTSQTTQTMTNAVTQVVTPPADTTGPVISAATSLSLAEHDATIVWTTNEAAIATFQYGTTQSYGSQATLPAGALLAHTAVLTGLTSGTTYYYCIHTTDLSGNSSNSCNHSFTTSSATPVVDTTPPNVSLITVAPITSTGATVNFTTDEVGNARIEYGTSAGYGSNTNLDTTLALTHAVALSNLTPSTLYHYHIITSDQLGNETVMSDETFTTAAASGGTSVPVQVETPTVQVPADTTPPSISGVGMASLGITNATIGWTTSELAVSTLEYGTTQNYGTQATLPLSTFLAHTATLSGLTAGTTYYYCIHATDLAGNAATSCPHSFTTDSAPISVPQTPTDTTPPQISLITVAPIATSSATVGWTTNELSTSVFQYGTTAGYSTTVTLTGGVALTHSTTLNSLQPNTTYHFRITSTDASGNSQMSADETFSTDALPVVQSGIPQIQVQTQGQPVPQVEQTIPQASTVLISNIEASSLSTSTVTIAWSTHLPSDSQVEYGTSENFGSVTTLDSTLVTSHSVTIIGLTPNTNYIFRVKSKPLGASAATVSSNEEFNTLNHTVPVVAPANIVSVSSGSITNSGATITWTTDKGATSQVEYGANTAYGSVSTESETLATSHSVSLSNLNSGTTYHYRVKSVDEVGNITFSKDYTFITIGSPSGSPTTPPTPIVTGDGETPTVDAQGADGEVVLEINEGNPNVNEDIVIERDGQVIYEGNSETFTDTNVQNGVTHNYTVFARSSGGGSSSPVNISIAAKSGVRQVLFNTSGALASSTPVFHFVRTWQKGDKDIEIEHLQEILAADQEVNPDDIVTGYFGNLTQKTLMLFQAKHRLAQTGIVDTATQNELNAISLIETKLEIPADYAILESDLQYDNNGEDVQDLQQYLMYEGSYPEGIVSGWFGPLTQSAVKTFQAKYNIDPVSGYVGTKTRHKMRDLIGL